MKKHLILFGALAVLGLFASCQKETAVVPGQEAQTQNVININTMDLKGDADLEPLMALGESVLVGDKKKASKLEIIVRDVLVELFRDVANMIGANRQNPVHSANYFGNWKSFGLAVDRIRQLSYDAGTAGEKNFLTVQLGNAGELKVGSFEIMPVSNFKLNLNGDLSDLNWAVSQTITPDSADPEGFDITSYDNVFVSNALVVRFSYKHSTYMFVVYAESNNLDSQNFTGNGAGFGLIFGKCGDSSEALIRKYGEMVTMSEGNIVSFGEFDLDVNPSLLLQYATAADAQLYRAIYKGFRLNCKIDDSKVSLELSQNPGHMYEGWWRANMSSNQPEEFRELFRDYIHAVSFGCNQSECRALSSCFYDVFPPEECDDNFVTMLGYDAHQEMREKFEYLAPETRATYFVNLALEPEAASGLVWKPAFGTNLISAEGSSEFMSFTRFNNLEQSDKYAFWTRQCKEETYISLCPGWMEMTGNYMEQIELLRSMMPVLVQPGEYESRMIDQMIGSEFGRHIATTNPYGNGGNFYTYDPRAGWLDAPYTIIMNQMYPAFFRICEIAETKSLLYNWARLLRVIGTQRLSDIYGPVPFDFVGEGLYDVQFVPEKDLYNIFIKELREISEFFTNSLGSNDPSVNYLRSADPVYGGDLMKWIKFINTLQLRYVLRMSDIDPASAKGFVWETIDRSKFGFIEKPEEAAWYHLDAGQINPYYSASHSSNGGDFRISADLVTHMQTDPRLQAYATVVTEGPDEGVYMGVRNGVEKNYETQAGHNLLSNVNIGKHDPLLIMSASESFFLRAECALRGWIGGDAKQMYEYGIRASFVERNLPESAANEYLAGQTSPTDYNCKSYPEESCSVANKVTLGVFEGRIEQIMTQKWIANFPNGWETWADFRRIGLPVHFPVVDNKSVNSIGGPVDSMIGMRRLPFPPSLAIANREAYEQAVSYLGQDSSDTRIWWAVGRFN